MNPTSTQIIIENYIEAYNNFDVDGMLLHMHPEVVFENIANGEVTLEVKGIENFRAQAEEAKRYFTKREQKISSLSLNGEVAEVQIAYEAVLAIDLPNGLKAGDMLALEGKSVFTFADGKIIRLQDFS